MKKIIFKLSFVAFLFIMQSFTPVKMKYISSEAKLSITFPTTYETINKNGDGYSSVETQGNLNDQLFMASYQIHKVQMTEHEAMAIVSLESFNEALGGKITKQSTWMVNKNRGVQASIDIPASNLKAEYKVVLIGQIQYQVVVISEASIWNQANADKFFKSFKVKK